MKHLIYGLSDSLIPEKIRYIGQTTTSLNKRLISHRCKAKLRLKAIEQHKNKPKPSSK